jgi:hypothetical protein
MRETVADVDESCFNAEIETVRRYVGDSRDLATKDLTSTPC